MNAHDIHRVRGEIGTERRCRALTGPQQLLVDQRQRFNILQEGRDLLHPPHITQQWRALKDVATLTLPQRLPVRCEIDERRKIRVEQQAHRPRPRSRAISMRCTSLVPSPISRTLLSRQKRATGYSFIKP